MRDGRGHRRPTTAGRSASLATAEHLRACWFGSAGKEIARQAGKSAAQYGPHKSMGRGRGLRLLCGSARWTEHPGGVEGGDDLAASTRWDGRRRTGAAGLDVYEGYPGCREHVQVVLPGGVIPQPSRWSRCPAPPLRIPAPPALHRPDRPGPTHRWRTRGDPAHGQRHRSVSIAGKYHSVGQHFAGRRITPRLQTTLAHVVLDAALIRTITLTLTPTPTQRARLPGARTPGPAPLLNQRPTRVQRTVSCRGGTQIIDQRIQVGATLCRPDRHHRSRRDHPASLRPPRTLNRACSPHRRKEVTRHKADGHTTNRKTG
jgi:hypothetical protein